MILNRVLELTLVAWRVELVPTDHPDLIVRRDPRDKIGFLVHDIAHFEPFLLENRDEKLIDIGVEAFFRVEETDENA